MMTENETNVSELIQLVGSNPLPLYISASTLRPNIVYLLCTDETRPVAERLQREYKKYNIGAELLFIRDATSPLSCETVVTDRLSNAFLDYTGGTKVMAVNVYRAWSQHRGTLSRACYVDSEKDVLRFGDGKNVPITTELSLDLLVRLHGFRLLETRSSLPDADRMRELDKEVEKYLEAIERGEKTDRTADGFWFEEWVAGLLKHRLDTPLKVYWGARIAPPHAPGMELDVVAIRGHKTFVLSCTIGPKYDPAKRKAFEVILRSHQIGGNHARAALVSPIDIVMNPSPSRWSSDELIDQAYNLESSVKSHWNDPIAFKVFSRSDIEEWVGFAGAKKKVDSLRRWIES